MAKLESINSAVSRAQVPQQPTRRSQTSLAATLSALTVFLLACSPADDGRTAGQRLDAAIATTEQRSGELAVDAKQAADKAARVVARTSKDIAITAEINAGLARDETLSALSIDVDTGDGKVSLQGTAPSDAARERAGVIAKAVEGVRVVDNQLQIKTVN